MSQVQKTIVDSEQIQEKVRSIKTSIFAPKLFEGKTVLVTGGGTGIGYAIARELGSLGAHVILAARTVEKLDQAVVELQNIGIKADRHPVNIRNEEEVNRLFKEINERWGTVDFLVNNAGGQFASPALKISKKGFHAVVDLNLQGTWLMTSAYAHQLIHTGKRGKIINIVLCLASGLPGMVHAGAARAGVVNMTQTLAVEWGDYGININAIAPGIINTSGIDNYSPDNMKTLVERLPIKRMGTPQELAAAVAFLLSPGGDFITGITLEVDGGEHLTGALQRFPNESVKQVD